MLRVCSKCAAEKDIAAFSRDASCRGGRRPDCKECVNKVRAAYRSRNRGKIRRAHRAYRYGITPEAMDALLARPCGICGGIAEVVDHDHACCPGMGSCGRCVRGPLCESCNKGLGFLRDSPALLEAAVAHLAAFEILDESSDSASQ